MKTINFALPLGKLTHGVMAALQILILPVKVRVLMGQLKSPLATSRGLLNFTPLSCRYNDMHSRSACLFDELPNLIIHKLLT